MISNEPKKMIIFTSSGLELTNSFRVRHLCASTECEDPNIETD